MTQDSTPAGIEFDTEASLPHRVWYVVGNGERVATVAVTQRDRLVWDDPDLGQLCVTTTRPSAVVALRRGLELKSGHHETVRRQGRTVATVSRIKPEPLPAGSLDARRVLAAQCSANAAAAETAATEAFELVEAVTPDVGTAFFRDTQTRQAAGVHPKWAWYISDLSLEFRVKVPVLTEAVENGSAFAVINERYPCIKLRRLRESAVDAIRPAFAPPVPLPRW